MSQAHDAVSDAAADLYRMPPEDFIASRDERVKALRKDGDASAAKQVAALRKPTVGAWLVNLLVADEPELAEQVTALADQLRTAQEQLVGEDLRALGRQRQELVSGLVSRARKLGRDAGRKVTGSVLDTEVESSLRAALADPGVAREVLSGRLTHAAEFTGFGPAPTTAGPRSAPPRDRGKAGRASGSKARSKKTTTAKEKPAAVGETAAERRRAEQRERTREQALAKLAEAEETLATAQSEHADAKADAATVAERLAPAQDSVDDLRKQLKQAEAEQDQVKGETEQATWRARRAAAALKAAQASVGRASDRLARLDRADR